MTRRIRAANWLQRQNLASAGDALREALELVDASHADCPALARKIRSALKSHGGAMRHMDHRLQRTDANA